MNALAKPEVGEYLNKHFVSSFQKVATFQIVQGQKQGGNVAAYFCAPDGRVLHCVAGPVSGEQMLAEARWTVEAARESVAESTKTGTAFKTLFRRRHAERLRREHGLVVDAAAFDAPETDGDGPLTYRDPTGRPLVQALPPPPIDGPDVQFKAMQEREAKLAGACELRDRAGRRCVLGNQGRVHQLMAAYSMLKIERIYGTVFENILGEKVSTKPVVTINSRGDRRTDVCLHCESKTASNEK
ncbi:MAG TPA: hypothetical protein VJU16_08680 [Planctomycetota bacterium]|nr:hypothetical protein [Planctomycetota bacterium]